MATVHFRSPSPPPELYEQPPSLEGIANRVASIRAEEIEAIGKALVRIALYNKDAESRAKALQPAISRIADAFARPRDFIENGLFLRCGDCTLQLSLQTAASLEKKELHFAVADTTRYLRYSLQALVQAGGV